MKKIICLVTVFCLAVLVGSVIAQAATYDIGRLDDLDHSYYYNVAFKIDPGDQITGAQLTLNNIYNYSSADIANMLFINLLDAQSKDVPAGNFAITSGIDGDSTVSNFFGSASQIYAYHDPLGGWPNAQTIVLDFQALGVLQLLQTYAADGFFALGFDPDCHFYNNGITLTVTTVPEPGIPLLLGLGLIAIVWSGRRKRQ